MIFSGIFSLGKSKKIKKRLVINCEQLETRVALLNNSKIEEYQIERKDEENIAGSVFLGKIVNYQPALQAAFVDIGAEKHAFLHYWDMLPATFENAEKILADRAKNIKKAERRYSPSSEVQGLLKSINSKRQRIDLNQIPKIFPPGSEVIVQVSKGAIGAKGAKVTANVTIPGRYIVLMPFSDDIGISKKIEDKKERERIRKILLDLDLPEGMGCICRTFGEGRKEIYFKRDLDMLLELWNRGFEENKSIKAPCVIFKEPNLVERTIRDFLTEDIDEIVVDDKKCYEYIKEMLARLVSKSMANKVKFHASAKPIFEEYGVEDQIPAIYDRKIQLPGGGSICIDETEALVAIDVNSGTLRGKNQAETILKTNLEACDEIGRQLRLRNIGGIIVIDFIDMRSPSDREAVLKKMREIAKSDRARTKVFPIGPAGLMEMTRQRDNESLRETVFDPCPYCEGRGKVKSAVSMSVEIQRKLKQVTLKHKREKDFAVRVIMHPTVLARMKNSDSEFLAEIEKKYGAQISFRGDPSVHLEEFRLVDPVTGTEYL